MNVGHYLVDTMQGKQLKSFFVSHPKLLEFAFVGTMAGTAIGFELSGVTGNAGP